MACLFSIHFCKLDYTLSDQLKRPIREGTRNAGYEYTELLGALNRLLHHAIIPNAEGVVGVWTQLVQRDALNDF